MFGFHLSSSSRPETLKKVPIDMDETQQLLVAAQLSGSIVGAILNRAAGLWELLSEIFVSAAFATFVGPFLCEWLNLTSSHAQAFLDFMSGVFGFLLMFAAYTWIKNNRIVDKVLEDYVRRNSP